MISQKTRLLLTLLLLLLGIIASFLGMLSPQILALAILFTILINAYSNTPYFRRPKGQYAIAIIWLITILVGVAIGIYRPEGFSYPLIFSMDSLHENGKPFDLYLNTGKFLAGYLALLYLFDKQPYDTAIFNSKRSIILLITGLVLCTIGSAYLLLNLSWYPKVAFFTLTFLVVNLFVTCVAEETFMRLIAQRQIGLWVKKISDKKMIIELIPIVVTTFIFVITHSMANPKIVLVYTIAGLAYATVYSLTKRLEISIATHFGVNLIHFSLLTYPI